MYAVFQSGGHQLRAKEGDVVTVDKLPGQEGDKIVFDRVLMIGGGDAAFGAPTVSGASVEATIKSQFRNDKVTVFKYKRKKNYKVTRGHRQPVTSVEINKINRG